MLFRSNSFERVPSLQGYLIGLRPAFTGLLEFIFSSPSIAGKSATNPFIGKMKSVLPINIFGKAIINNPNLSVLCLEPPNPSWTTMSGICCSLNFPKFYLGIITKSYNKILVNYIYIMPFSGFFVKKIKKQKSF